MKNLYLKFKKFLCDYLDLLYLYVTKSPIQSSPLGKYYKLHCEISTTSHCDCENCTDPTCKCKCHNSTSQPQDSDTHDYFLDEEE